MEGSYKQWLISSDRTQSVCAVVTWLLSFAGMEGSYKQYQNQHSTNSLGLNKHQHNEERDRKRYLSHKFSLTPLSDFKWNGAMYGTRQLTVTTLRQSITQLESSIPGPFLHSNWPANRQNWVKAVHMCQTPKDFALAISILEACMKPVLFNPVWHESLGRIQRTHNQHVEVDCRDG